MYMNKNFRDVSGRNLFLEPSFDISRNIQDLVILSKITCNMVSQLSKRQIEPPRYTLVSTCIYLIKLYYVQVSYLLMGNVSRYRAGRLLPALFMAVTKNSYI